MNTPTFTRRQLLKTALPAAGIFAGFDRFVLAGEKELPPVRTITSGPKYHWFGYYDKLEFDPTGRYVLGMAVDFEHRPPKPEDAIEIGMVDLHEKDRWIPLGTSTAWCWQQGCMLQWVPGSDTKILWNDRENGRYVCRILDVQSKEQRTISTPIYALAPDGKTAVATDFRRLQDTRPGYGYNGIPDPYADEAAPQKSGIWRIDLETGARELIMSLADAAQLGDGIDASWKAKHWFNHLLVSPSGRRFIFLHRWKTAGQGGWKTRMITVRLDGSDPYVLDPSGHTSHFIWRDPEHVLAWSRPQGEPSGFYLFRDKTREVTPVGPEKMTRDGHCTYLPGNEWILNDTYPDSNRNQHVYLYHVASGKWVPIGRFHLPPAYSGQWRCDTHPRSSPDGTQVVIDAPHDGGRQLHLIDISNIVT